MKKLLAILLVLVSVFAIASCNNTNNKPDDNTNNNTVNPGDDNKDPAVEDEDLANLPVMTYDEYIAAEINSPVAVEVFVQATQSWWDNKITVYAADEDGAYFIYEMKCSEEDAAKLVPGTKICVRGYKAEWAGEIEITNCSFSFVEDETLIVDAEDLTDLLGTDELINYQNAFASFRGLLVKKIEYKGGERGSDIYVTLAHNGADYSFCVESYLTSPDSDVYKAVEALKPGDAVNVEGFLYWYEGVNTHITSVEVIDPMSYAEFDAASINDEVVVYAYVQATQSWWDNKITVYTADADGAYFIYERACSEEDAAKLVPGTKIAVYGYKAEWAGEVEIADCYCVILEADPYIAEAVDLTALLGTDELIKYQNRLASFKGLTVESIEYKGGEPGDDIYVKLSYNGVTYSFCVERYLTGPDTDIYKTVQALNAGDVIDVEGFLYWYEGVNTHITSVTVK